jgi:PAS domain S-box-containing protein
MPAPRKIRARDIVRDIRAGMTDAELMEKYRLSAKGVQVIFEQVLRAKIIPASELKDRNSAYVDTVTLEDLRLLPRMNLFAPLPIHEQSQPEATGMVQDITARGLRVTNLDVSEGDHKKLVIPADELFMIDRVVLDAKCRWTERQGPSQQIFAGFEITDIESGNIGELLLLIQSISRADRDSDQCGGPSAEDEDTTDSVDLAGLVAADLTSSGSFSFEGIGQTWFGKLLQALPLAALVVDESYDVLFANQSCSCISPDYENIRGRQLASLFPNPWASDEILGLAKKVFSTRRREVSRAVVEIERSRIWGRITFRSIRMGMYRCLLLLIEDLTLEREQLFLKEKHAEEILRERNELERRNDRMLKEIAERKKAEAELRKSKETVEALLNATSDLAFLLDANGVFLAANDATRHSFASHLEALTGKSLFSGLSSELSPTLREAFTKAIETSGPSRLEIELLERTFSMSFQPVTDVEGEVYAVAGYARDISDQKKAQNALLQTERVKALGEMAGGVAHNFNNMLQVVITGAQTALADLDDRNPQKIRESLSQIVESAKLGSDTVKRLQEFARVRKAETAVDGRVIDLGSTIQQAVEMSKPWWKSAAEQRGISISLELDLEKDCRVRGEETELFEVIVNLIKNAAEALPQGGAIEISTTTSKDSVILKVRDNGVGIPADCLGKVFEPFWSTKGSQGTGLGLASSFGIVKRHLGGISVESDGTSGTTFSVTLPSVESRPSTLPSTDLSRQPATFKILLVDDMEPVLKTLKEGLVEMGQSVLTARSGRETLAEIEKSEVDVIICDLEMPDMNGWQVARSVKEMCEKLARPPIPFILFTGWAGLADKTKKMAECGVGRILAKPIDIKILLQSVSDLIAAECDPTQ